MTKESKGKIVIDLSGNLQYQLEIEYDYDYDCDAYGCDYICRCRTIVNTRLEAMSAYKAVSLASSFFQDGEGHEGNFGFALTVRFLKHLFTNVDDFFEIRTCGGYYGDEIEGVFAESGAEYHFQKQCEAFNAMTNSERVRLVLELEYGHLLPEVEKIDEWQLIQLPVSEVKADGGVSDRTSRAIVQSYQWLTPWYNAKYTAWKEHKDWFPAVVAIPKKAGEYRVIDGFHRYRAWTEKPYGIGQKKWKALRKNKKIWAIVPKV